MLAVGTDRADGKRGNKKSEPKVFPETRAGHDTIPNFQNQMAGAKRKVGQADESCSQIEIGMVAKCRARRWMEQGGN
jgi:hypothetical protein